MTTTTPGRSQGAFAGQLKAVPTKPGVYLMKDAGGQIIYVGKAASLRNRLRSYFQTPAGKETKVRVMIARIADFEYIVAESVSEALLLENLLIKQHKPFYNARLKDDKTYPYIKIDPSEEFPQVYFTRRVLPDGARYFGPFASAGSVRKTMDLLKKLFPYRSCTKAITGTDERPCLEYYIHRCVAPCIGNVDRGQYGDVIKQVVLFLEGNSEQVQRELKQQMLAASEALQFERAAALRDQVRAIESVSEAQKVVSARNVDEDVVALAHDKGEVWVELFKIRRGKLIGRDHFLMEGGEVDDPPRLQEQFIQQFYDAAIDIPGVIQVQHPLEDTQALEEWLAAKRHAKVQIRRPQRGEKKRLVEMAAQNAQESLNQKRIKWLSESDKVLQALSELQSALDLPELPDRIECYDISHVQGTNQVGSMVVFEEGRPKPAHYRRFQIKTVDGNNDFASLQEVLRRRFRRLAEERREEREAGERTSPSIPPLRGEGRDTPSPLVGERDGERGPEGGRSRKRRHARTGALADENALTGERHEAQSSFGLVPGLVIIDGGKGQLSAVQEVFLELGITDIPLCSLAKQEEEIFLPHMPEPVLLPRQSQALYLVQRIRDEAHRFAITYHRQRRSKSATRSLLDEVPGIGPRRRRELLRRFGSVAGIREASADDLASVPGMSASLASRVLRQLGVDGGDASLPPEGEG